MTNLRYAIRMLLKNPGVTVIAAVALALGIGANTAIFSVVNAVMIRPLPFRDSSRLVMVWEKKQGSGRDQNVISPANYLDWKEQNSVFEDMAAFYDSRFNLTGVADPEEIPGQRVTVNAFDLLGSEPLLGRTFEAADSGRNVALLSFGLWRRRFGGDPGIVGASIQLNGNAFNVIGVMPADFRWFIKNQSTTGASAELWAPLAFDQNDRVRRGRYAQAVARLSDGVSVAAAQSQMTALGAELERRYPDFNTGWGINLVPLRDQFAGELRRPLLMLLGAVALVLLIACTNVANLLLARAAARRKEMAIRLAIGASRGRIIRQLLVESVALAALGGTAGLLIAMWGVDALAALGPRELLPPGSARLNPAVLGFAALVSLVTGLFFGLAPAVEASRTNLNETLKEGGRAAIGGGAARFRGLLVVAEVAMAVLLLTGAGLMIRSFSRLESVNPGFNPNNLLTARISLSSSRYGQPVDRLRFFREALDRVRQIPGVQSAGEVSFLPMTGLGAATGFAVAGRPFPLPGEWPIVDARVCDADYFQTMNIPLLQGRTFTAREQAEQAHVVVVSETLAREMFPGEDPIGKGLIIEMMNDPPVSTIIGVVADVRHGGLDSTVRSMSYWPHIELPYSSMTLVLRTDGDPARYISEVRREIQALDANQPIASVYTMDQLMAESVARTRFTTLLLAVFGGVALVLAAVGIYGVMSYSVSQRTQEIGIRMALGADAGSVMAMVLREGMTLALSGVGVGLLAAFFLTRVMTGMLFGVGAKDPMTFIAIAAVLAGAGLAACFFPARRATRVDPMIALRYE